MACGPWTLRNLQGVWLDPSVGEYGTVRRRYAAARDARRATRALATLVIRGFVQAAPPGVLTLVHV